MTLLFYLLKRELAAEAVSISSTDEAKTEFKKIMDDHGNFYLIGVGLFTQFAFRGFEFAPRNSSSLLSFK
ncbi:hypothetical protein RA13_03055 [Bacillus atrophaeus]|nr:hypothetical protein RA13_03055 [Bacillus atrophaeus]